MLEFLRDRIQLFVIILAWVFVIEPLAVPLTWV